MSKKQSKKSAPKSATKPTSKPAPKSKAAPAKKPAPKAQAKKAPAKAAKKSTAKAATPSSTKNAGKKAATSSSKPTSSTAMRDRAIAQAQFARKIVNRYATGFEDVTAQPTNLPNHLLWSLGHLAATASWFNTLMAKDASHTVPSNYESLFGMDSKPVSDPSAYPSFDEVKKNFDNSFETLIANAMNFNDEQLQAPPEQDGHGFVSDKLDCLFKLAWHEAWHLGQIVDQRRALGITVKG